MLPVTLVIIAMLSVQSGAVVAKQIFPIIGPLGTAALRLFFAAIILAGVLRPWRHPLGPGAWRAVLIYGVSLGGMNSLFYAAIDRIPLGVATALEITGPLAVAIFSSRRLIDYLWIALAGVGLLLLLPIRPDTGLDPLGAAYALGAGVCWAIYIIFGKRAGAEHGVQTTALGLIIATICVLPIALAQLGMAIFSPTILLLAIAVAILSAALPYSLEMIAFGKLPSRVIGTLMSLQPAAAAIFGLVLIGERLTTLQWGAIGAIMAASAATTLTADTADEAAVLGADPVVVVTAEE
jgi:inner membrane transporter RhtA